MKTSKEHFKTDWAVAIELFQKLDHDSFRYFKTCELAVKEFMEDWDEDQGFGSSDRWAAIYSKICFSTFDEATQLWCYPETVEEMETYVDAVLVDLIVYSGFDRQTAESFVANSEGFMKLFA